MNAHQMQKLSLYVLHIYCDQACAVHEEEFKEASDVPRSCRRWYMPACCRGLQRLLWACSGKCKSSVRQLKSSTTSIAGSCHEQLPTHDSHLSNLCSSFAGRSSLMNSSCSAAHTGPSISKVQCDRRLTYD